MLFVRAGDYVEVDSIARRMDNACSWPGEKAKKTKDAGHDVVSDT